MPSSYPRSSSLPPSYKRPSDKDVSALYPEENEKSKILSEGTALVLISIIPPPNSPGMSAEYVF